MMDLRASLNAISAVVVNRPKPLREFDQIYMRIADMLIQAEHVSKWLKDANTVFIGDGDAIALCIVHLVALEQLKIGPKTVHVLDFDERVINSVNRFSKHYGYERIISATLYNVADPLPQQHYGKYQAFYTNPPFGASNDGASIEAFLLRGIEAISPSGICCAVLADYPELPWCASVLRNAQSFLIDNGFVITELVPQFHTYHLDDTPDLTSCSLIAKRLGDCHTSVEGMSSPLPKEQLEHFYGAHGPLNVHHVRDLSNNGKSVSNEYELEPF